MTKGTDNKDEFDFSEFDETDDNQNEKANKASLADDNKDNLDELFSGDFDFESDDTSNNEDIPILTDFVSKDEVSETTSKIDDFDDFDFGEMEGTAQPASNVSSEKVDLDDFNFDELDSTTDVTDNDVNAVSTDDFDFTELEIPFEDTITKETDTESTVDEFDFDELELTDTSAAPSEIKSNEDDFNFDELDNTPILNETQEQDSTDDFDFTELDADPTVDPDLIANEPETLEPLGPVQADFDVATDFDFDDTPITDQPEAIDLSDDFDFKETLADSSIKESNENVSVSNDDFDFDDDVLSKDFNNDETLVDAKHLNDDFDFDEFNDKETVNENLDALATIDDVTSDLLLDEVQNDFEEILEKEDTSSFSFDEPPVAMVAETNDFDFDFNDDNNTMKVDESKDIVNNGIYNNNGDKGMSDKKDTNDFDFEESNDFDFGDEVSAKKDTKEDDFNDFDFGNDTVSTKEDEFDTKFDMDDKDDFDFGAQKDDNDHENDFGINNDTHEEQEEEVAAPAKTGKKEKKSKVVADSDGSEKKPTSPVFKYTLLALAVALLGGAGFIGYTKYFPTYEEEEETEQQAVQEVQKPVKKDAKVEPKVEKPKKEVKVDSSDLADLDSLSVATPTPKPAKQVQVAADVTPVVNNFNGEQINKDYEKLQGQFAQVIGSVSKMSNEIESLKSENQRMQTLLSKVKAEGNNADFENFQLDFSGLKNEVNSLKKQVAADKDFSKETMIKFLAISKKLKEEVSNLKGSQVNKDEIDSKLNEINELSKQVQLLNTKVANNEVMTKLANLEKNINDKKLQDVETKLQKTEKAQTNSSNKQRSVLELLEEKNKEKALERNTVVVDEDDEDLKVPLSVTIEEDSEESPKPVVKKQTVKKKTNHEYFFIGTIEGVVYLKSASGSISEYRVNEQLPGYGEILKIYKDGSIETENGNVKFKEK